MSFRRVVLALCFSFLAACSGPVKNQPESKKAPEPQEKPAVVEKPVVAEQPQVVAPAPVARARRLPPKAAPKSVSTPKPVDTAAAQPPAPPPSPVSLPIYRPAPVETPLAPPVLDEPKPIPVDDTPRKVRIPSGTLIAIRMIDSVNSATAHVGESFKASLDAPVTLEKETVIPKGADVYVKLAKVQSAGSVSGRSELQLQLDRIFVGSKSYTVESNLHVATGASQGAKTARTAGIGAAIGAAIGAIAGGGKGAVIGGATGAGAGVGVEAATKGEQVRIDSESPLTFRLERSLEVTLGSSTPHP